MATTNFKQPKARELLGGDLLAQSLAQLGATVAFGLHGGHLDAFLIGCDLAGIRLVDTRHETVAVQAAEAYAKISGNVGVCFVTANSGFSNGLPGLATAFADRSPIFCVTSSPPLRDAETNCLQGFHDQVVLAKPLTKFAHRVTNVEEIPRIVSYAFRTAHSGTPGPVLVDFPIDVLFSPPRMDALSYGSVGLGPASAPGPDPASIEKLLELWKSAFRPVVISGTGAARTTSPGSKTSPLLQLAEATSTPIFYSSKFAPAIPHSSPLRGGPAVLLAALKVTSQPVPDLVVLLGARTGFLLGGRGGAIIPAEECTLVQIDLDGAEIGKSLPVNLGIVSDANLFISSFLSALKSTSTTIPSHDSWFKTINNLKSQPSPYDSSPKTISSDGGRLHPYHALKSIFTSIPEGSIIMIDGGEAGVWALDLLEHARASHALASTGYLGFLGNGWGYSLGAAVACPDRLVVNIQGDGSAGFHIAELDTYARHNLNILTVVMNNAYWGMSVAGQDLIYGEDDQARPVSRLGGKCRFDVVAQGFGCDGVRVEKWEDVQKTVERLTGSDGGDGGGGGDVRGPALIDLIISREPVTETTKGMVGKTDDKDMIVVPYYDNVPRPFYKEQVKKAVQSAAQNGTVNGSRGTRRASEIISYVDSW